MCNLSFGKRVNLQLRLFSKLWNHLTLDAIFVYDNYYDFSTIPNDACFRTNNSIHFFPKKKNNKNYNEIKFEMLYCCMFEMLSSAMDTLFQCVLTSWKNAAETYDNNFQNVIIYYFFDFFIINCLIQWRSWINLYFQ